MISASVPAGSDSVGSAKRKLQARRTIADCTAGVAARRDHLSEDRTIMSTILLIVLILLLVGALPTWPHSSSWGYYPSGGLGLVLVIVLILLLLGVF
jgi:hypothetical protein